MSKKVLVISSSLRVGGNSDLLADEFARGAKEAGNSVEKINLAGKTINFCRGCLACQKTMRCVIKDDAAEIAQKMLTADVIAFATPIYYYEMSGQLKTMLDRANPLFPADYSFRDIYFIATAADGEDEAAERAINGLGGWIECFPKAKLAGTVLGMGVDEKGEILEHPEMLMNAFETGKKV
jgi:multimeric flavodoxin WrbA